MTRGRPAAPAPAAAALCLQCGLPARGRPSPDGRLFCCFGCRLVHEITGASGEEGQARAHLVRLMLAAFLAMGMMMFSTLLYADAWFPEGGGQALGPLSSWFRWIAFGFAAPLLPLLGWPIARSLFQKSASLTDSLILLGAGSAFLFSAINLMRGSGDVHVETGATVLLLVTAGRYLESLARSRAKERVGDLLELTPPRARRIGRGGEEPAGREELVAVEEVRTGDRLRVLPGERFPADGTVLEGRGQVDASLVTGESGGRSVGAGDAVHAGSSNLEGVIELEVTAGAGERWIDEAQRLLDQAKLQQGPLVRAADRMARAFLVLAPAVAGGTFLFWAPRAGALEALLRGLSVLLVACPCALGIATPLATWAAIGRAARRGVLVRGGEALEALARCRVVVFDKTGTLTRPALEVSGLRAAEGVGEEELLEVAAALGRASLHPASAAIAAEADRQGLGGAVARGVVVESGLGVAGEVGGRSALLGSRRFLESRNGGGVRFEEAERGTSGGGGGTAVLVAWDGRFRGEVQLREELRPEARAVLAELAALGYDTEVLSGDRPEAGARLQEELGITVRAGLLPMDKVSRIEELRSAGREVVMVGDGVNDTPALARASVGIAMGGGIDLVRQACEVVLLGGASGASLEALPRLVRLSRRTVRRIRWNLFWAFAYNSLGMAAAAAGLLGPATAAGLMVLSSLFVVGGSFWGMER